MPSMDPGATRDRRHPVEAVRAGAALFDNRFILFLRAHAVALLRVSLGVVFLWFGILKLAGQSPVEGLVGTVAYWAPTGMAVVALGLWETATGALLVARRLLRAALFMLWTLLAGTFVAFVVAPWVVFRDSNPLLLTMEGEFVVKNLVLITAGLVVGAHIRRMRPAQSKSTPAEESSGNP